MSTSNKICNDGASKSNNDGVCEVNSMLQNMTTADIVENNTCANCGKEGNDVTNTCNKCKSVMYCNAACKKKHRHKHKNVCERIVAEKKECERRAAELLHDENLFKQPPPEEDCPICFLRMPILETGRRYQPCCGKVICSGCVYANAHIDLKKQLCPFCRTESPGSDEEAVEREIKRVEIGDAMAIFNLGYYYGHGIYGLPQSRSKALEFYHRAGELGFAESYYNIGNAYLRGNGVEVDKKKAIHYYELAAMKGDAMARQNLGNLEAQAGNMDRAVKHYTIAASGGHSGSLKMIKLMYKERHLTKDDYTKALRAYQTYLDEIKSDQRDEAAAYDDDHKYLDD